MITKGYVITKSQNTPNKYLVRIPIFESAGQSDINQAISECTLSHNPGTYEALRPGDCVFISFEDNLYSKPVILGKLFVNVESESSGYQYNTDLKVTHKATLPVDTTIGSVPFDNILNYFNSINESIDRLNIQTLSSLSANLILYPTTSSSDVSGYFKMVTSIDDLSYNTTAVNIPTGIINTNNQLLASLVSEPGVIIGNPGVINITTIGNIKRTVGNNNQYAAFYFTISKRSISGTETLLTTSNETPNVIIGNIYEQFSATALLNNGEFLNTDRIVIKYYANLTGNPGSNYDFQFGGTNPVRTLFPVPVSSIPSPKASNIITDTTFFNGILSSADNTTQKALNTLDDHNHNSLYYTETEVDTLLSGKSDTGHLHDDRYYTETESDARYLQLTGGTVGPVDITGNLRLTGTPTLTNQSRTIEFTGFDKEGEGDFSDAAFIKHTINTGGHTGSVLEISSQNDSTDGIAFTTNASSQLKHNSNIIWDAGNDGSGSGLDADLLDGLNSTAFSLEGHNHDWASITGQRTLTRDDASLRGDAGARSGFFETNVPTNYYSGASSWQHLIEARHTNDGNNYAMQIAGSFFDQDFWVRKINNVVNTPWNKLLHSGNIASFNQLHSSSDFADGTLVTTDIDYSGFSGDSFQIEIEGKSYSEGYPWMVRGQGYIYDNTIYAPSRGLVDYTGNFPTSSFRAFNLGGVLCFWWPRVSYWNSFSVKVYESITSGGKTNRVTSISNSVIPAGRTREVDFPALKAMHTAGGIFTGSITTPNNAVGIIIGDDSRLADRNVGNTMFLEGVQNNDRGFVNFSSTTGNALGAINGNPLTWRGNNVWNNTNGSGGIRFFSEGTVQNNVRFTVSGTTLTINTTTGSAI
jgi:hypothetical protein